MIEELKNNLNEEIKILRELYSFSERVAEENHKDKEVYLEMISSLKKRINLLNKSIPTILREISLTKKLSPKKSEKINVKKPLAQSGKFIRPADTPMLTLSEKDKKKYLKELNISDSLVKKLTKTKKKKIDGKKGYRRVSKFAKYSNKYFFETSNKFIKEGNFKNLRLSLQQSNLNILATTYVSMIFFGLILSIFVGFFLMLFFLFFNLKFGFPFFTLHDGSYISRFLKVFWIMFGVPLTTLAMFYLYPGAEKKTLESRINQELPFAVIHMSSISGSGIPPLEIFKIIGLSDEYKYLGPEIRKIINRTNIYGYDLTSALRSIAHSTPSKKLAELLNGISVTIHSGGDMKSFFDKRAESLLLGYRLEREKYTKSTETFMDLYISIVIAAPMILLMLLIMVSVADVGLGIGIGQLSMAIVGIVAIINIVFLTFLHLKQPGY